LRVSRSSIFLALGLLLAPTAPAQQLTVAGLGVRVRLTPFTGSRVTGTLFRLTEDTVRLTIPDAAFFLGEVRKLEVSRGRRPNGVWGSLIGAGIGAVGGAAAGAILGGISGDGGSVGEGAAILGAIGLGGGAVLGGITGLFLETQHWRRVTPARFWEEGVRVRARTSALDQPIVGYLGGIGLDGSVTVRTGSDVVAIPRERLAELAVEAGSRPRFKWPTIIGSAVGLAGGTVLGATSENLEYAPAGLLLGAAAGALVGVAIRSPRWTVVVGNARDARPDTRPASAPQLRSGPAAFCFQARPAARCRAFMVSEFGAYYRLDETYGQERHYLLIGGLGAMVNVGAHDAVGVALDATAHGAVQYPGEFYPDLGLGASMRYRRWLGDDWRIDLSGGMPFPGANRVLGEVRFPSAALEVKANWRDMIGVAARWEPTFYQYRDMTLADLPSSNPFGVYNGTSATISLTEHAWYVGAEVGRLPGAVAVVFGSAVIIVGKLLNVGT
jgi:hypothetical protein